MSSKVRGSRRLGGSTVAGFSSPTPVEKTDSIGPQESVKSYYGGETTCLDLGHAACGVSASARAVFNLRIKDMIAEMGRRISESLPVVWHNCLEDEARRCREFGYNEDVEDSLRCFVGATILCDLYGKERLRDIVGEKNMSILS